LIDDASVTVVMPAYRAAKTLQTTYEAMPHAVVDHVLVVDDASDDATVEVAQALGLDCYVHEENRGYGANQKTCYLQALVTKADVIIMLHPDYQYDPRLVTPMAGMIASGVYDVVLGSRILGGGALSGGMPLWKYVANRALTFIQNIALGAKLSEYHTGYRAYSREFLEQLDLDRYSDNFIFDNQLLVDAIISGARIGEISVPTRYFPEASSIKLWASVVYGVGVLGSTVNGLVRRSTKVLRERQR
jgi:glycosyltransferase involved in cell wall biosynthesis